MNSEQRNPAEDLLNLWSGWVRITHRCRSFRHLFRLRPAALNGPALRLTRNSGLHPNPTARAGVSGMQFDTFEVVKV